MQPGKKTSDGDERKTDPPSLKLPPSLRLRRTGRRGESREPRWGAGGGRNSLCKVEDEDENENEDDLGEPRSGRRRSAALPLGGVS
jgi:hypothetical protein